jgi:hypothetical protein
MVKFYLILGIFFQILVSQISDGYYLFSPVISFPEENQLYSTYLMDTSDTIIHEWVHDKSTASTPYLLPDSTLLRPCKVNPPAFDAGGVGGLLQILSWNNDIVWEYHISSIQETQHHDIEPLPNGNILVVAWDRRTQAEALAAGKASHTGDLWSEKIIEIKPIYPDSCEIVWEWKLWDHLVQDYDSELNNYGNISSSHGLLDINFALGSNEGPLPPQFTDPDMVHLNAIDYNEALDQIVISSRKTNEIYIIDHSISSEAAEGDLGNFLYRWGNPKMYNCGTSADQLLYAPHSVNWLADDKLILFNNGVNRPGGNYSSVETVLLPIFENGNYSHQSGEAFLPNFSTYSYNIGQDYYTQSQGGAFQLPDGNMLVTISTMKTILELDPSGEIVFEYYHDENGNIPRAQKYDLTYLSGQLLGDINFDSQVDILDIVQCVNIILSTSDYIESADINQDTIIDILDIILIINIILL